MTNRNGAVMRLTWIGLGLACVIIAIWSLMFWHFYHSTLDQFEKALSKQTENTIFYDLAGRPFYTLEGSEAREYVKLDRISPHMIWATLAVEDTRFFRHFGFDPIRLIHSISSTLLGGRTTHGASTITQQLVKLTLLSPERTITRKVKELFMAIVLEIAYDKEQILEFYLNRVYLGFGNYGVESASQNYFKKSAAQLSLAEAALLAALIKKPEGYSPFKRESCKGEQQERKKDCIANTRKTLIIRRLARLGWISTAERNLALRTKVRFAAHRGQKSAPYFVNHILLQLFNAYGAAQIYNHGLRIYTTLDLNLQQSLESVVAQRMSGQRSFDQIAAVSIEPESGFVKALVGGADFSKSEFNRATQAQRQPGSSFKSILYSAALENGLDAEDIFIDEPTDYAYQRKGEDGTYETEVYEPQNYNNTYNGPMTVGEAFVASNNVISVQILDSIGYAALVNTAQKFGIPVDSRLGLCLALGCQEVSLLQLTSAYTVFSNGGYRRKPVFILRVEDQEGNVLEEHGPHPKQEVLTQGTSEVMHQFLSDVLIYGTGKNASLPGAAGKTGTNNDFRDAWFIGYTEQLATGFWIGNDDNRSMNYETGGSTPASLWKKFMLQTHSFAQ